MAEPSAEPTEARIASYRQRLAQLRRSSALSDGDVACLLPELTSVATEVLGVERVSVWHLSADAETLECVHACQRGSGRHSRGGSLSLHEHPRYFAALASERILVSADARRDPRTRELERSRLSDQEVGARIDVPVLLRGRLVGVLCFEHTGGVREFQFWQELLAASLADMVALVLQLREQARAEAQLKQVRAAMDDLLESRTSSVVRENADLQREVDALHLTAEAMRKAEDERRRLFAASPVPMLLVHRSDRSVLFANDTCAQALRYGPSELVSSSSTSCSRRSPISSDVLSLLEKGGEADAREIQLGAKKATLLGAAFGTARGVRRRRLRAVRLHRSHDVRKPWSTSCVCWPSATR